jgi:hypothetical protein
MDLFYAGSNLFSKYDKRICALLYLLSAWQVLFIGNTWYRNRLHEIPLLTLPPPTAIMIYRCYGFVEKL